MAHLYRITTAGEYVGQGCLNIFHFLELSEVGNTVDIATEFAQVVIPAIINMQSNTYQWKFMKLENLTTGEDELEVNLSEVYGQQGGQTLFPFMSLAFKLPNASKNIRAGGKRFAGVTEDFTNNSALDPLYQSFIDVLSDALATVLVTNLTEYVPVVASFKDPARVLVSQIIAGIFSRFSTQNSRKDYKGAGPITARGVGLGALGLTTTEGGINETSATTTIGPPSLAATKTSGFVLYQASALPNL